MIGYKSFFNLPPLLLKTPVNNPKKNRKYGIPSVICICHFSRSAGIFTTERPNIFIVVTAKLIAANLILNNAAAVPAKIKDNNAPTIPTPYIMLAGIDRMASTKDNIPNIIPVINEYKIPITFFIATDPVENQGIFCWTFFEKCKDKLPNYFENNSLDLKNIKEKDRKRIIQDLKKRCKKKVIREVMEIEEVKSLAQNPKPHLSGIAKHKIKERYYAN